MALVHPDGTPNSWAKLDAYIKAVRAERKLRRERLEKFLVLWNNYDHSHAERGSVENQLDQRDAQRHKRREKFLDWLAELDAGNAVAAPGDEAIFNLPDDLLCRLVEANEASDDLDDVRRYLAKGVAADEAERIIARVRELAATEKTAEGQP